jgi:hypothetical protein
MLDHAFILLEKILYIHVNLDTESTTSSLIKHHRLPPIQKHPLLTPPLDCRRKHLTLHVTPLLHQLLRTQRMIDPRNALLDNRALVQIRSHKVRARADNFNAALVRLVVRLRALEGRQERVVDVYYLAGHLRAQARREDLHVAREDDEVNVVFGDEVQDSGFLLFFGVFCNGEVVEFDSIVLRQFREFGVVGHDD